MTCALVISMSAHFLSIHRNRTDWDSQLFNNVSVSSPKKQLLAGRDTHRKTLELESLRALGSPMICARSGSKVGNEFLSAHLAMTVGRDLNAALLILSVIIAIPVPNGDQLSKFFVNVSFIVFIRTAAAAIKT
jgi:hypothetical protein